MSDVFGEDLEGDGCGLSQILSRYLHGGTEENHGSRCPGGDPNRAPLGKKHGALPLDRPAQVRGVSEQRFGWTRFWGRLFGTSMQKYWYSKDLSNSD
jgi:hypothetical protein